MFWVAPCAGVLSVMVLLSSFITPAGAAQVIIDDIRQWAHRAVKNETSSDFKPAANTVAVLYFQNQTRQPGFDFLKKGMAVLLNVPENGIVGNPSGSGTLDDMLRVEKEILFGINGLLRLELSAAQKEALRKPITPNLKALMFLVKGIESSDRGAYDHAADDYRYRGWSLTAAFTRRV
jgi:hypothetical protein